MGIVTNEWGGLRSKRIKLKMLKLLYFVPCERAIMSSDNIVTIVNVLDALNFAVKGDFPKDAAVPFLWDVMTTWHRSDETDAHKVFEQKTELYRPDGELAFDVIAEFNTIDQITHRVINKIGAIPVGIEGTLWLKLSIRELGEGNEWIQLAEYPLFVRHVVAVEELKGENKNENKVEQSIEAVE